MVAHRYSAHNSVIFNKIVPIMYLYHAPLFLSPNINPTPNFRSKVMPCNIISISKVHQTSKFTFEHTDITATSQVPQNYQKWPKKTV